MSGIAGVFRRDGRTLDRAALDGMVESIAHRGPDGRGVWAVQSIGLGHAMLWTTPESLGERLPYASDGLVITADARIDNRAELRSALALSGIPNEEVPDSRLILLAYRKWGEACVERLVGDFAFAIWDERKQALFCARDHFGVKALYYHCSESVFVLGSEIKAVLSLPEVPRDLDDTKIFDFLTSRFDDTSNTFYKSVRRLPPAHCLTVGRDSVNLRRYWSLDPERELKLGSDGEYAERFRELFSQAVSRRLRSAYPVGSLLSGGLDSSAIACVAHRTLSQQCGAKLKTFSAVFDDVPESDERPYIEAVLSEYDMEPHFVRGDRLSPMGDLERVLWHQDEALYAFNHFLNWNLYSEAHDSGVRVLLDGFDGDTTVSHGEGYMIELARSLRLLALARESRAAARMGDVSAARVFWSNLWRFRMETAPGMRRLQRLVRKIMPIRPKLGVDESSNRAIIVNPMFAESLASTTGARAGRRGTVKTQREYHFRLLSWGVMPYTLELLDRATPAFSIEPRYPFWDKDLVEFCLALPAEQKIRNGWGRLVMRRGLEGILPRAIQWRQDKANMGYNFKHCLSKFEQRRLEGVIVNCPEAIEGYVNLEAARAAFNRFVSQDAADEDAMAVWKAASLALWLEFVRGDASHSWSRRRSTDGVKGQEGLLQA